MKHSQPYRAVPQHLLAALSLVLTVLTAPASAAVMISQVYGGGGNAGAPLRNDFVELHNNGAAAVSVAGWMVQYSSATGTSWNNQKVILSGNIPAGGYYLIALGSGGANGAALPAAEASATFNMSATAGKLALVSSSTSLAAVTCPLGDASIIDFVGYGATANCAEPSTGASPAPAPAAATAVIRSSVGNSCLDTNTNSTDFVVATPVPRNTASPAQPCAGTGGGGGGGGTPTDKFIHDIQGSGATSPFANTLVRTSGVVTRINSNGFFIQDAVGDGNPATSDGIFVFTTPATYPAVQVGNLVQVTGTVVEFSTGGSTLTEINAVTAVTLQGSGSITPTVVSLPLAEGDSFERFEGMLVQINTPLTVQQNNFQARYGQITVGAGGRHETPTNVVAPGAPAQAMAALQARSRLLLDDGSSLQFVNPTPYAGANGLPRAGDTIASLTGVLDFGPATSNSGAPGLYRLHPTLAPSVVVGNPRPASPPAVGGNVRVASMNVLNFFTTFTNGNTASGQTGQGCTVGGSTSAGNCRGADNITEFNRQRDKIVVALAAMNADAVGLMEIQNNSSVAAQNLVDALNATVGAGSYAVVPDPVQGTGTDAIKVAMIYKPARLSRAGGSVSDTDAINNRPTLAQTFMAANGERFTMVVNHFKSKGSCPSGGGADADQGDGQGCWNATRLAQAQRLRIFVAQLQSGSGSNDVLLIGDLNAYGQEDPIRNLTSSGYVDQMGRFSALAYSYVFDGTAGRLDHGITTASMSPKIAGAAYWHIDADESQAQDYNLENKQPACATCAPDPYLGDVPFRASDHDPALVGLSIYKNITGTAARDVLVGSAGDDRITGGPGADLLTGGAGADLFVYASVLDGGDTVTDFQPGLDKIVVRDILRSIKRGDLADPFGPGYITCSVARGSALVAIDTDGGAGLLPPRALALLQGQTCAAVMNTQNFVF